MGIDQKLLYGLLVMVGIVLIAIVVFQLSPRQPTTDGESSQRFQRGGLSTNTSIASISLNDVLSGTPKKDDIPAITQPKFVDILSASEFVDDDMMGIVVTQGSTTRFYSYNILVWHEIVNDEIEDKPVLVTFCPLCGSAIVFDPAVDGDVFSFGVSGKLYESNLLMYDTKTESLWSQSIGEAVVGDMTGKKLSLIASQVITFEQFKQTYKDGEVLSTDTGHRRDYSFYPYGGYNESEAVYFPISVKDNRLPAKTIMYVVNAGEKSIAFKINELVEGEEVVVNAGGQDIVAVLSDGEIEVRVRGEESIIPGYHEMWFSWATRHQEDGIVWPN